MLTVFLFTSIEEPVLCCSAPIWLEGWKMMGILLLLRQVPSSCVFPCALGVSRSHRPLPEATRLCRSGVSNDAMLVA